MHTDCTCVHVVYVLTSRTHAFSSWRTSINLTITALICLRERKKKKPHESHKEWRYQMKMSANATEAKQLTGSTGDSGRVREAGDTVRGAENRPAGTAALPVSLQQAWSKIPFGSSKILKKEKKKERRKKEKPPGETCDRYFLLSEKVLLSLLSSSRLLTFSLFIYVGFSLCERRGSSSDAGSHPLLGYVQPHGVSEGNTGSVALCLSK